MEKRTINIIIGFVLLGGATTGILINRNIKKKKEQQILDIINGNKTDPNNQSGQTIISNADLDKLPNGTFPLKIGDKNKKVYALQQTLNANYGTSIDLDGKYGDSTFKAMCSNVWNKGFGSSYYSSCFDVHLTKEPTRKTISESDYETVKNKKALTT